MQDNQEEQTQEQAGAHPLRSAFRKAIRTAIKRAESKEEKLQAEISDCAKAVYYLECGEIIKANFKEITRGQTEALLPDMYNPGQQRLIELDEHLKPLDNAKKYFKKQRKLQAGQEKIEAQLQICAQ
jgi:predicted ribosome quality control (RQC) complex YloA/Tae2 family protein